MRPRTRNPRPGNRQGGGARNDSPEEVGGANVFHADCGVYLGQEWLNFDPRFNVPRIGRVKVVHGADAVDGAFATIYGEANLTMFEVWAY